MQIQETMVYRFKRKRERDTAVVLRDRWNWRAGIVGLVCHFTFDLRKTRHGTERHIFL